MLRYLLRSRQRQLIAFALDKPLKGVALNQIGRRYEGGRSGRGGASAGRESACAAPDAIGVTEGGAAGCPLCTVTDACAAAGATTSSK